MEISYQPIGIIHSPFPAIEGMPVQPTGAAGTRGWIEIYPRFADGLKDLSGFSHVILLYHFHAAGVPRLVVTPFLDTEQRGVFSTRAPTRPNPIGLSVVRLVRISEHQLFVEDVDVLDGTPLLDIKPFVPAFDVPDAERVGWIEEGRSRVRTQRSDSRFG